MGVLSEQARKNKIAYNVKRNKELTSLFSVRLPKEEYKEMEKHLKSINMNKAEFIRWAYEKLKEGD